jgi:hypothetical protein
MYWNGISAPQARPTPTLRYAAVAHAVARAVSVGYVIAGVGRKSVGYMYCVGGSNALSHPTVVCNAVD